MEQEFWCRSLKVGAGDLSKDALLLVANGLEALPILVKVSIFQLKSFSFDIKLIKLKYILMIIKILELNFYLIGVDDHGM